MSLTVRVRQWLFRDAYSLLGWMLFAIIVVFEWRNYIRKHEAIYLLGPRRVFDPEFLANDLSWSTLPPTTLAYDYLFAPLFNVWDDFGIVTVGRIVTWVLFAWGLALLARTIRLPVWTVLAGFVLWFLWGQRIANCGSPLEGLQPKSFAYPLAFMSLAFVMQGRMIRAGVAIGIATVFHIIIGGWSCMAIFFSLAINRRYFSVRDLGLFIAGTVPFILPLVLVVAFFHTAGLAPGEQLLMDRIYTIFAQPHCIDPAMIMSESVWLRALTIFPVSLALVFLWPEHRSARVLGCFLAGLIALFALGLLAGQAEWYTLLKLYPLQLAGALPALFLFVFCLALLMRRHSLTTPGKVATGLGVLLCLYLVFDEQVLTEEIIEVPTQFVRMLDVDEPIRYGRDVSVHRRAMYKWIREQTPRDSVFITPYLPEFWTYAEREQVAGFRHPPHDRRLIEWQERLIALNGSNEFRNRGFGIKKELTRNVGRLSAEQLGQIRTLYGATHYLVDRRRAEFDDYLLFSVGGYYLYDLARFAPEGAVPVVHRGASFTAR